MAAVRRNAPWLAPLALLLLMGVIGWRGFRGQIPQASAAVAAAAAQHQTYPALDPTAAYQIDRLRKDAGLDDDVLGVLNLDSATLVNVLASVRSWYESNAVQLDARQRGLAEQREMVRALHSRIQMGEDL